MKNKYFIIIAILIFGITSNITIAQQLIAHYPLSSNANDSTGNNPPMTMINTPFLDGGIYCNGIYSGGVNPNYSHAITPLLPNLNLNSFSISAHFKVIEPLTEIHPVFVGGQSFRWVAFYLAPDGTVLLKYNNSNYEFSNVHYILNQWHLAKITYKDSTADLYLDDTLAISFNFALIHGDDKEVGITDLASGRVFKGILRDLKIYNLDTLTTDIKRIEYVNPKLFNLNQNYPNPFNPSTMISWQSPVSSWQTMKVYDVLGNEVATLVNEYKPAGNYEVEFSAKGGSVGSLQLASGIYLYKLQVYPAVSGAGIFVETKKMMLLK